MDPLIGHTDKVHSVSFSPDGKTLVSGSEDNTIILWNVASRGQLMDQIRDYTGRVLSVVFSPIGDTLASGSSGGAITPSGISCQCKSRCRILLIFVNFQDTC